MASYNPYEHREVTSKSASNLEVFVHMIKGSFGIGVLSLPFAVHRSGYLISSIIGIPLIIIIIYGLHVLIRTMVKISAMKQQPYTPFEDCVKTVVASGPKALQKTAMCAKYTVRTFLITFPVGTGAAYVIFITNSIFEFYSIVGDEMASVYIYKAMLLVPLFLINCIPNLHRMVAFSAIADILTLVCFGALFYYIFGEGPHITGDHHMLTQNLFNIPLIIGPVLFALEAISLILSLEERMKTPKSFLGYFGIYNLSMAVVILIYFVIGISAYIKYGDNIQPSVTSNLPANWVSDSFKILFIIIIYLSYPIQCYPVIAILWEDNFSLKVPPQKNKVGYEYAFRFGLTLLTVIIAAVIPKFEVIVTLLGAVCISSLGLFLPCYMEYLYYWSENQGKYNLTMIKDLFLMVVSALMVLVVVLCTIIDEIRQAHSLATADSDTSNKMGWPAKLYGM